MRRLAELLRSRTAQWALAICTMWGLVLLLSHAEVSRRPSCAEGRVLVRDVDSAYVCVEGGRP